MSVECRAPCDAQIFKLYQVKNFRDCEKDCSRVLKLCPSPAQVMKALYRRARAREELSQFEDALKDAREAVGTWVFAGLIEFTCDS